MNRFGVRIVIKNRAVFIPAQSADADHGGFVVLGVVPRPLGIDDAGGDFEAGASVEYAGVAFVDESVLAEGIAQQLEGDAVGGAGGGVAVVEAAFRTSGGLRVVHLHAAHAVGCDLFPHLEEVRLELLVGLIEGDVGLAAQFLFCKS